MTKQGSRPDDTQIGINSRQSFVLLALLFLAPLLIAWLMMSGGKGLIPKGTTNHGMLVQPVRLLELPAAIRTADDGVLPADYLRGKWTLIYMGDADCNDTCVQNLYKMRQVRFAQNENIKRVQRLFLLTDTGIPPALGTTLKNYSGMDVTLLSPVQVEAVAAQLQIDATDVRGAERVYLVDPRGYLMMYYPPDAAPKGMLKDLKKLLKYSQIG